MRSELKSSRIAWVDLLETLAIFMVVAYHCTAYIGGRDLASAGSSFYIYYFFRSILAVCVPLFFFVNGYLLFRQEFSFPKHLKRILKFILIAIFWYAATLAFMGLFHMEQIRSSGLISTLTSLKTGINHLWYLGALVCIYLIFPLLKVVYDRNKTVFKYLAIICLVLTLGNSLLNEGFTFVNAIMGKPGLFVETNFFSIFNPLRGVYTFSFMYFCLGGLANIYQDKIQSFAMRRRKLVAICGVIVGWLGLFGVGVLYSRLTGQVWDNVWHGYDTVWGLCAATGIFLLSLTYSRRSRFLEVVSRNTLGIYLIHMLIIFAVSQLIDDTIAAYLSPITASSLPIILLGNFIYTGVIFILSLLISMLLRRIPLLQRSVS